MRTLPVLRSALAATFAMFLSGTHALAASPWTSGLAEALLHDDDAVVGGCVHAGESHLAAMRRAFGITSVALARGPHLIVVEGMAACVCSENCKVEVFRDDGGGRYAPVLSDYAIRTNVRDDGTAVIDAHDSAAVSVRTSYRYDGKKYAVTRTDLVLEGRNIVKPAKMPVKFAAGAFSATLSGTRASAGFGDNYTFDANAGQTVTATVLRHDRHFGELTLVTPKGDDVRPRADRSIAYKLLESGTYALTVDGSDDALTSYSVELSIR